LKRYTDDNLARPAAGEPARPPSAVHEQHGQPDKLPRHQFQLPRCPKCRSSQLRVQKTQPLPDGTQKWFKCVSCSHHFVALFS